MSVRRAVTGDEPMPASVVAVADPSDGDAAVLKIARNSLPILPFAEGVAVGEELVIVECPPTGNGATPAPGPTPSASDNRGPVQPGFRTAVVTDDDPHVVVEPSGPAPPADLPGGVVLNHDAAIVGVVDTGQPDRDVLVDTSVIRDLLSEADVDTALGPVDRDYRAGLDAYYAGRYTESIQLFDSVLAVIPSHVQAHEYRGEAQALREAQGGGQSPAPDVWDRVNRFINRFINGRSGSLVGLGVLVAILVFLVHRRRPPHSGPVMPTDDASPADERESDQS